MAALSVTVGTARHKPLIEKATCDYARCMVLVTVFSFVFEMICLMLHNPYAMSNKNIMDGYDVLTGKKATGNFWDSTHLSRDATPVPYDPSCKIGGINCCTTFQETCKRFCIQPHHMAVSTILFYGKAHVKYHGLLSASLLFATFGLSKLKILHLFFFWQIIGYDPNLDVGWG